MKRSSFCALLLGAAGIRAADPPAVFAVIASPDVPSNDVSIADLRKLFLGDKQFWTPNLRVNLLVRAPIARERAAVVWTICRMTEAQFGRHWIQKVMRADCTSSPRQFTSNLAAVSLVRATPGAIAIINASQVAEGVKVLSVEGKLPNQPGYALTITD